jgi:hypothetical protein
MHALSVPVAAFNPCIADCSDFFAQTLTVELVAALVLGLRALAFTQHRLR